MTRTSEENGAFTVHHPCRVFGVVLTASSCLAFGACGSSGDDSRPAAPQSPLKSAADNPSPEADTTGTGEPSSRTLSPDASMSAAELSTIAAKYHSLSGAIGKINESPTPPAESGEFRYDTEGNLDPQGTIVDSIDFERSSACVSNTESQISVRYDSPSEGVYTIAFFRRPGCVDQIGAVSAKDGDGSLSNDSPLLHAIVDALGK